MRRAIFAIAATIAGLVALLTFKTSAVQGPTALPPTTSIPTRTEPRRSAGPSTGWFDGPTVNTKFGPVQVKVKLSGGRLTDVQAVQLPGPATLSRKISAYVAPKLRLEALRAQSAQIDVVSGATYTVHGYQQSMQAALDSAR
jgi:uncharacterized protein with FMN-binding domain